MDCILNICKNATHTQLAKINEIKKHESADNDYLLISISCEDIYTVDMWVGLSKNEKTKNEKYYNVCGVNIDVTRQYRTIYGLSDTLLMLFNNCCVALTSFCVGVDFLKDEVKQVL